MPWNQVPEQGEAGQRGVIGSNFRYRANTTLSPFDRLKNAPPAAGSGDCSSGAFNLLAYVLDTG